MSIFRWAGMLGRIHKAEKKHKAKKVTIRIYEFDNKANLYNW